MIAIVAASALFAQAMLSALAVPAAFAAMRSGPLFKGAGQILICTGAGMKRIVVDPGGERIDYPGGDRGDLCAACHFTGCAALAAPAAPCASLPACRAEPPAPALVQARADDTALLHCRPRGPPSRPV